MDLKSIAEAYQSIQEGKVNAGLQAYLDKKKGKKSNGDDKKEMNGNGNGNGKASKGSKPDFLDLDKDGNKTEPMKSAAKSKNCLLYTSPSPRDLSTSRMPSSA